MFRQLRLNMFQLFAKTGKMGAAGLIAVRARKSEISNKIRDVSIDCQPGGF